MLASCVIGVWLSFSCISAAPTPVRKSATPDSKENEQADTEQGLLKKQAEYQTQAQPLVVFQETCYIVRRESAFGAFVFCLDVY